MRRTRLMELALLVLAVCGALNQTEGLTIYRIGGENRPPPEIEGNDVDFRQLSWSAVDPQSGGERTLVTIDAKGMAPLSFGPEDNIALTVRDRGGTLRTQVYNGFTPTAETDRVIDGDPETTFEETARFGEAGNVGGAGIVGKTFFFELGGLFTVDRVRFYPRKGAQDRVVEHFVIATNTTETGGEFGAFSETASRTGGGLFPFQGAILYDRGLVFDIVKDVKENRKPFVDVALAKTPIQRLVVWVAPQRAFWEIAELEVFAEGFVPKASYVSNIIDLGAVSSLGWVRWSGRQDPRARVVIRSQSGDDSDPNIYWRRTFRGDEQVTYGTSGRTLTQRDYTKLDLSERGMITHDSENWELWSAPYNFGDSLGVPLVASKPHRYVQFQVELESAFHDGSRLEFLEFAVSSPPIASDLVGEIDPMKVEVSQVTQFLYAVRPIIELNDRGFDSLEIRAPGGRVVSVDRVRIAGKEVPFESTEMEPDRLIVHFPPMDSQQTGELLEMFFHGEVFRYGTTFSGRVFDSKHPQEVWQTIRAGNATERMDGNSLLVQTVSLARSVLDGLNLTPAVFTPDGNGINDVLKVSYDLLKLTVPIPVTVWVYDMTGRPLKEVYTGQDRAGRHVRLWDGRDRWGHMVEPGLYICQVEVETSEGHQTQSRLLSVIY